MPTIELETAIGAIRGILEERIEAELRSPFFFIAGAGISSPPIPLAREIESHCRERAVRNGTKETPPSDQAIDKYSYYFSEGYRSAESRQRYLRKLMEKTAISKANLRLAHILLDGRLARTVFTPNFDDMLSRALALFGQRPLICDHPLTVGRMRIDTKDIQVIHVHGSCWFYDCANLTREITDRSGNKPMSLMLDQALREHSPLVIGYSGWEGDILMDALRRRIEGGSLGVPLFWFCYRRDAMKTLPKWLTECSEAYFVLPKERASTSGAPGETAVAAGQKAGTGSKQDEERLTAQDVLGALVHGLNLPVPPFRDNPLKFYADQLSELLGKGEADEVEQDTFYSFHEAIQRVERARDWESSMRATVAPAVLDDFQRAMSTADYRGAIRIAKAIDANGLTTGEKQDLLLAVRDAAIGLNDNSLEELAGYELVGRLSTVLQKDGGLADARTRVASASACFNEGIILTALGREDDALAAYDKVVSLFGDAEDGAVRAQAGRALVNKAKILHGLGRNEEAILNGEQFLERFSESAEPIVVATALLNKGVALGDAGRTEEEIRAYQDLMTRFGHATDPGVRAQVGKALLNEGITYGLQNRNDEAIACYDTLLDRHGAAVELPLQVLEAKALVNKGFRFAHLRRTDEAITVYSEVVKQFGDSGEASLQEQVARAFTGMAVCYEQSGRFELAEDACRKVLALSEGSQEPGAASRVEIATTTLKRLSARAAKGEAAKS